MASTIRTELDPPATTDIERALVRCIAELGRLQTKIDDVPLGRQPNVAYEVLANSVYVCSEALEELGGVDAAQEAVREKAFRALRGVHHMMLALYVRGRG